MDPRRAARLVTALVPRLAAHPADLVVSPALGGIVFGYEVGRQLGLPAVFVERVEGRFALRRGFAVEPGQRVLVAEDVVTTGLSTRECVACCRARGGEVVAACCLVDRSGGRAGLDVPLVALASLDLPTYPADALPPDLAAIPAGQAGLANHGHRLTLRPQPRAIDGPGVAPSLPTRGSVWSRGGPTMPKEIFCAFGVDVDAVAGWLGSYGGEDSPCDISRGLFAGEVGSMRLLRLFERFGHQDHLVRARPLDRDLPRADARRGRGRARDRDARLQPREPDRHDPGAGGGDLRQVHRGDHRLRRQAPVGYVAPWWEFGSKTNELLLKKGIKYDHSLMHNDFEPYYVRVGDSWTKIDYSQHPSTWMKPLQRGTETGLIEIPASWYLDDLPPMMFIKAAPNSHGFVNPRDLEQIWRDQFDWVYREMDYAVYTLTIHPDVSGKPQVLLMLERLFAYINTHPGVRWGTFEDIADDFAKRRPRAG
jgi:orotate phosphoribosyltransferase